MRPGLGDGIEVRRDPFLQSCAPGFRGFRSVALADGLLWLAVGSDATSEPSDP